MRRRAAVLGKRLPPDEKGRTAMRSHSQAPREERSDFYEIRVGGTLEESWSARLGGMQSRPERGEDGSMNTVLTGVLPDQASLSGVLAALYGLGLSLLSVQARLPEKDA
jgi:hypothetical protein